MDQLLLLNQYLSDSEFDFIDESLAYIQRAYDCGDARSEEAFQSVRDKISHSRHAVQLSTFELFCTLKVVQIYVNDMTAEEGNDLIGLEGNMVLEHLVFAGTRGAKFKVDNQGPPDTTLH